MRETLGSQRLLQAAVAQQQMIDPKIREALQLNDEIDIQWISPVAADGFKEYRDGEALERLKIALNDHSLEDFWPSRGPVWDGLARTSSGHVILVEAKAHISELASPRSMAGPESLEKIEAAFSIVRAEVAPRSSAPWTSTFYQYANRLAFLYLIRKNGFDAHLIHVLFLNATDVNGPSAPEEWKGALSLLRAALGLQSHRLKPYVHELFVDARSLDPAQIPVVARRGPSGRSRLEC